MNDDYNINCGGCCYVAAVLAEQLENYKIPFKVAIAYCPTHYWIKVSDRHINRDDFQKEYLKDWTSERLYYIYYNENWNDCYNRKWNLIVKTRIVSLFKKCENSRSRLYTRTSRS